MKYGWTFRLGALLATAIPSAHAETPEDFLTNIIRDFEGNDSGRLKRVTGPSLDPDMVAGAYLLNEISLVVVSHWEQAQVEKRGEEVCITVRFEVVARSEGARFPSWEREEARQLTRIDPRQVEDVPYCAVQREGIWKLKDWPLPRVGRLAMLADLGERLARAESRLQKLTNPDPRALLHRTRVRDWYQRQLDAISSD